MKKEKEILEIRLIDKIANSTTLQIGTDLSEVALDSVLENGILKDLPGFNLVSGGIKTVQNIREQIFAKKILLFLKSLDDCKSKRKELFLDKMNQNLKEKQKVGERLIVILEKLDSMEKPSIIGNLFKAYIEEKLSYTEFIRASAIINQIIVHELEIVRELNGKLKEIPTETIQYLTTSGLLNSYIKTNDFSAILPANVKSFKSEIAYTWNKTASNIFKHGLQIKFEKSEVF